jgi:hypothetical protein
LNGYKFNSVWFEPAKFHEVRGVSLVNFKAGGQEMRKELDFQCATQSGGGSHAA